MVSKREKKKSLNLHEVYRSIRKTMPPPTRIQQAQRKKTRRDSKQYIRKDKWKDE